MCRGGTNACAHHLDFQHNNFEDVFSIVKKRPLLVNLADLIVGNILILNVPHLLWVWDFVEIYLTHLEIRIKWCTIHAYLKKLFFWPPKLYCPQLAQGKKTFSLTLNFMILQMIRNECVKFGRHVDRQVNYKILGLKVPNFAQSTFLLIGAALRQFW
jgi:hypothetical protein